MSAQLADERAQAAPMPGQVGGRAVMLIPHREPGADESVLLPDYQRITAAVRQAAGPVMVLGESVGWTSACGPSWSVPLGPLLLSSSPRPGCARVRNFTTTL
ncbi:hypothetical protein [Streptomyces sp. AS58]|uniref:hypothetical protein n=1 Tax=Streptomyces sp. AS58 TaxID=1519489 RepID=UPI001F470452|nr:hypothetical protein [Streptomyces sp. AS58]